MSGFVACGWRDRRQDHGRRGSLASLGRVLIVAATALVAGSPAAMAQEALLPGEAFVTRFSGTATIDGPGGPQTVIDLAGPSGVAVDLRNPGYAPDGRHWLAEPHGFSVSAGDVGQVFGVALDDASPPNIYLTATAAFGLHRTPDNAGWMDGMWGPGGGPGTVYRLTAANGYQPEVFATVTLDGRANSGAALGNIAFDRWHRQLFVSDLETGMIHRLALADGADLGHYDHGTTGRAAFTDAATGTAASLPPVAFDPATSARIADCPSGDFARTPSCWNLADFRRRVWGLDVRQDAGTGSVRLYYAVWGSQGFGSPDWAAAGEDQQNSVWSVAIAEDGSFDASSVRREFFLPEFFRSAEAIARAGIGNPVADIAFPAIGDDPVMLLAERGGLRNLGLTAEDAFATPHEARVLRYEPDASGIWQPVGRYDVGFYDRQGDGPPYVRAGAAGGVAFGAGYTAAGAIDPAQPDGFVWMTGDALCSAAGACLDPAAGDHSDQSEVSGLEGENQSAFQEIIPAAAFQPYPAPGPATPPAGPDQSYMIDADVNVDGAGAPIPAELARNDATRIGDVAVFQQAAAGVPPAPVAELDLAITKRALGAACLAGSACPFEVTITNAGSLPYAGPLVVIDTSDGGAPPAVLPTPDWACAPVSSGVLQCDHAPVALAPGETISFTATFTVPAWWTGPVFSNCVELTVADARSYNNQTCGYAPATEPGTTYYAPDLRLTKFGLAGQCDLADNCLFVVRITNVGAAPYTGPLAFNDEVNFPGAAFGAWAPAPEWSCGPPGGGSFGCTYPPVTLSPGEFREVTLWIGAPPPTPGHTVVRNCAWIDWAGGPGDYNPANEYDCATISRFPPGFPGATALLEIEKDAEFQYCFAGAGPFAGWLCEYRITVTNTGGAPHFGPIEISDEVTVGPGPFQLSSVSPPWTCVPGIGSAGPYTCTRPPVPGGLQPGDHVTLFLSSEVTPAAPEGSAQENCATIRWDTDGDGVLESFQSCAITFICTPGSALCPHDLGVLKVSQPTPCFPGFPCKFAIFVDNVSSDPYPPPLVVTDIPDPGVGAPTVTWPPGIACVPAGGTFTCTVPFGLGPNAELPLDLSFAIPPGHPGPSFTNCARVPPGPANIFPFNDEDCATAFVPFPDLAPWSPSTCQRGSSCTLDVEIDNKGLLPFLGRAGVRGTLVPAVAITGISSQTAGLTCSVTGSGTYACDGVGLNIPPGGAARFQLVVDIPADFPHDAITHTKDMVWPDRTVKDKRPENDRHVSTITIEGPKEAEPPPPPALAKAADLALTKTAARQTCVAGQPCAFTIALRNAGAGPYVGPIVVGDIVTPATARLTGSGPSPWSCRGTGGNYTCTHPATTLAPGASTALSLTFVPSQGTTGSIGNCGALSWTDTARVMAVQRALAELGFTVGQPDGKIGPQTRQAIEAYQERASLAVTGRVDDALLRRLFGAWGVGDADAGNDRACATAAVQPPPPPAITCTGGTVRNNQCFCPTGTERQQVATNVFRCVKPPPAITCSGGTVRDGRCVCPKGTERQQVGTNAFRCVTPPPPAITCSGGTVRDGRCVCPKGTERQQVGTNAFRCVTPPPPAITCSGGTVRNNRCVCPKGTERQQVGTNAFRCVTPPPPAITCSGGTVRNNRCVCPAGTERRQVAANAFRCVTPQPSLTCSGGKVRNGRCVCPKGMTPQQVATNAFRCVKAPTELLTPAPQLQLIVPVVPQTQPTIQ
jgi:hypothetical protein